MLSGEIVDRVYTNLGDPEGVRFPPAHVVAAINQALRRMVRKAGLVLEGYASLQPTGDNPAYAFFALPADFRKIRSVELSGLPLVPAQPRQLVKLYSRWSLEQGTPLYYISGAAKLQVVPYLLDLTNGTPDLYYERAPRDIGISDQPDLPGDYHHALVNGATALLSAMPGEYQDKDSAAFYGGLMQADLDDLQGDAAKRLDNTTPRSARTQF